MSAKIPIDASFMRIGKIDDPEPPPYANASPSERLEVFELLKERARSMPKLREPPVSRDSRRWPTIAEILQAFTQQGVEFMVVGGYAVVFHGFVRNTDDIDLFIRPSVNNAESIIRAFYTLNFHHADLTVEGLTRLGSVFRFGHRPEQTELLLEVKGIGWDDAWKRSIPHELMGSIVRFVDVEDLIKANEAAGRPLDLVDVERLREIQRNSWLREQ